MSPLVGSPSFPSKILEESICQFVFLLLLGIAFSKFSIPSPEAGLPIVGSPASLILSISSSSSISFTENSGSAIFSFSFFALFKRAARIPFFSFSFISCPAILIFRSSSSSFSSEAGLPATGSPASSALSISSSSSSSTSLGSPLILLTKPASEILKIKSIEIKKSIKIIIIAPHLPIKITKGQARAAPKNPPPVPSFAASSIVSGAKKICKKESRAKIIIITPKKDERLSAVSSDFIILKPQRIKAIGNITNPIPNNSPPTSFILPPNPPAKLTRLKIFIAASAKRKIPMTSFLTSSLISILGNPNPNLEEYFFFFLLFLIINQAVLYCLLYKHYSSKFGLEQWNF